MMRAALIAFLVLVSGQAWGATERIAVIIGNDVGAPSRPALHYAAHDAEKVAAVLTEIGGVKRENVVLLENASLAEVKTALETTKQRILSLRSHGNDVVLLVYFSGHSDGISLEIAGGALEFTDLRKWMVDSRANVRIAIVDSCKSGALLAAKGGKVLRGFHVRLANQLATSGEAVLTSSAADELALESSEIGGSFFTHHFVSGLRGAADVSGDNHVTLGEAYRYAYERTALTTDATIVGPQHPTYAYRMSGEGELVLTDLTVGSEAHVNINVPYERILFVDQHGGIVAELTRGAASRLTVTAGAYTIAVTQEGQRRSEASLILHPGETRAVGQNDLIAKPLLVAVAGKGPDDTIIGDMQLQRPSQSGAWLIGVGAGVRHGASIDALPALTVDVRYGRRFGVGATIDVATSSAQDSGQHYRETNILGWLGPRFVQPIGPVDLVFGINVGGGRIAQSGVASYSSGVVGGGPTLALQVHITDAWRLTFTGDAPFVAAKRDNRTVGLFVPGGHAGLAFSF